MNDMHLQIEKTFFELAKGEGKNCLVLCDRGIMDLSVCKSLMWQTLPYYKLLAINSCWLMKLYCELAGPHTLSLPMACVL